MNKTVLIFKHEFSKTIKRGGFIVLTLSLPVLALLGIGISHIVSGISKPPSETYKIGYVDNTGNFNQFTTEGNTEFIPFDTNQSALEALVNKDVKEYFVIPQDYVTTGLVTRYTTQKELSPPASSYSAIAAFMSDNLMAGKLPAETMTRVQSGPSLVSVTLTPAGEPAPQSGYANFIVPAVFSFLLGLSLVFSSTYVIQSLSEEKENRVMEVLMSSVSPRQLLTGKVLGLGAAGLIQVLVWIISIPLLLTVASSSLGGILSTIHVPLYFWGFAVTYFILGYLMFAGLSASIAAVSSTVQEAQGLAGIYGIFNFVPFWLLSVILLYPNNPAWVVLSIFPLTSPVLVMMRMGLIGVPAWQLAASITVLALTVLGELWLSARLLRVYMLMYGKRHKLGEIIRNLRSQ